MTKIRLLISFLIFLFGHLYLQAQKNYPLIINCIDKPAGFATETLQLKQDFTSVTECRDYATNLLSVLQSKGYITASVDSVRFDSSKAMMDLFVGEQYKWRSLDTKRIEPGLLEAIGWNEKQFSGNITDLNLISPSANTLK